MSSDFEREMEPVQRRLDAAKREMDQNLALSSRTIFCPEHFENVIIFGECWKHNADGSMRSLVTKNQSV